MDFSTSAAFTFIVLPMNDYKCRIPLGSASTSFPGRKGRVKGFDCGNVLTAIGGSGGDIHPLFAVQHVWNKLENEKRRWEVTIHHKAHVLLFAAHKPTAHVVARIAEVNIHVVAYLACNLEGMLDQKLAELLPLIFGNNAKRTEGKYLLAVSDLIFKPCLRVHDVADDLAVLLEHKGKLRYEIGMISHHVYEVVLVSARLIDVPKRLTGQFFNYSVVFFGF